MFPLYFCNTSLNSKNDESLEIKFVQHTKIWYNNWYKYIYMYNVILSPEDLSVKVHIFPGAICISLYCTHWWDDNTIESFR